MLVTLHDRLQYHVASHETGNTEANATSRLRQNPDRINDCVQQSENAGHPEQIDGHRCRWICQHVHQTDNHVRQNVLQIVAMGTTSSLHVLVAETHRNSVHCCIFGIRISLCTFRCECIAGVCGNWKDASTTTHVRSQSMETGQTSHQQHFQRQQACPECIRTENFVVEAEQCQCHHAAIVWLGSVCGSRQLVDFQVKTRNIKKPVVCCYCFEVEATQKRSIMRTAEYVLFV